MKAIHLFTVGQLRTALAAMLVIGASATAFAQRVQFPTMVDSPPASPITSATPWTSGQSTFAAPSNSPLSTVPYDPYAAPLAQTTPPAFQPPPAYSPYAPSPYAAPPPATPYSPAPYSPTPSALYPEGIQMPQAPNVSFGNTLKFLQDMRLRWTWLSPMGDNSLGVNDVETNVTFAVPLFKVTSPLMITPGFGIHFWEGPATEAPYFAELPPNTYDAYLDAGWYPVINNWLSAQVGVRVGAYTDFNTFTDDSIRIMGRGLGVIAITPKVQLALGVVYLDRVRIKLLPAGGIIWVPHPDARYEFLFPNPRLARRWTTLGNTDIWFYGTGEYGGGSWTADIGPGSNQFDYNDIRIAGGIESFGLRGLHAYFEVGYVWERELVYRFDLPVYPASDTIMLRAGIDY